MVQDRRDLTDFGGTARTDTVSNNCSGSASGCHLLLTHPGATVIDRGNSIGSQQARVCSATAVGGRSPRQELVMRVGGRTVSRLWALLMSVPVVAMGLVSCVPDAPAPVPVVVATAALPEGTAGTTYLAALDATGGTGSITWTATGLPAGLSLSDDGVISGIPELAGTADVVAKVADANGTTATATLPLSVPSSMPPQCSAQSCAELAPDTHTVMIDAVRVAEVIRDPDDVITAVRITGTPPAVGAVVAIDAGGDLPSGLIAIVNSSTANPDLSSTLGVTVSDLGTAFAELALNSVPAPGVAKVASDRAALLGVSFTCSGNATIDAGSTTVTPSFTPSIAAVSNRPFAGSGGIYLGGGGLKFFNFDLSGSIEVALDFGVSAASTCTANLPTITKVIPVGGPVAVVIKLRPSLKLDVSGAARFGTTATLRCSAYYHWEDGRSSGNKYCKPSATPLQLDSANGVDATLTGAIDTSVTINEIAGITGNLTAALHAGWGPARTPQGQLDAKVTGQLGACLACFWKGSPAEATVLEGTLLDKVLATYGDHPTPPSPTSTTTTTTTSTTTPPGPHPLGGVEQLAAGNGTGCARLAGGAVKCWGHNFYGQLGDGTTTDSLTPVSVTGIAATIDIDTAGSSTCAVLSGGSIMCWGDNDYGQLGDGSRTSSAVPVAVSGITTATEVAAANDFSCALLSAGTVSCWGRNDNGQLGNNASGGTATFSSSPVPVVGISAATDISAAGSHACSRLAGGTVECWGYNQNGELGDGTTVTTRTPVTVSGIATAKQVAVGGGHGCALLVDGTVRCWGLNTDMVLGDDTTPNSLTPLEIPGIAGAVSISGAARSYCVVLQNDSALCWGSNSYGQLGNGAVANPPGGSVPVAVATTDQILRVEGGFFYFCAVLQTATAECWGHNSFGQLGNGNTTNSAIPVPVVDG